MKIFNLLIRILVCPCVLVIYTIYAFKISALWLCYGGEFMVYMNGEKKTINDIYQLIKEQKINN